MKIVSICQKVNACQVSQGVSSNDCKNNKNTCFEKGLLYRKGISANLKIQVFREGFHNLRS